MPFWSRRRDDAADAPDRPGAPNPADVSGPAASSVEGPPSGAQDLPCSRVDCTASNASACAYIDRRGRPCPTAWCPAHQREVGGRGYCLRHGGVVTAVLAVEGGSPFPDLENRAPSLAQYVGQAVSAAMVEAMRAAWPGEFQLGVYPVKLSYLGPERRRSWSRKWTMFSHQGDEVAVVVAVTEERDDVVIVRVDSDTVAELVPPWISDRSLAGDQRARQEFYTAIVDAARLAVAAAHARDAALRQRDAQVRRPGDIGNT